MRVRTLAVVLVALGTAQTAMAQKTSSRARADSIREAARVRAEVRAAARARAGIDQDVDVDVQVELDRELGRRGTPQTLDTLVSFDERGTVSVSCAGGNIIVTANERPEIRVRARNGSGGIRFTSTGSRAILEPAQGRGCRDGRFEIMVPYGVRLAASSSSGDVQVTGVRGNVEIHSLSADVQVRDAGGRLDVESLSGDIRVRNVTGEVSLHSISGDVTLSGARSDVELESVSGDLELSDVIARRVRTNSTSGDISFDGQIAPDGRYEFTTHSGDVTLRLADDVGAEMSVATYSGTIDSAIPITLKAGDHRIGSGQAKRLNFTVGRGTARLIVETFSGDVMLSTRPRR